MNNRYSVFFAVVIISIFIMSLVFSPFSYVLAQEGEEKDDNDTENLKKLLDVISETEEYIERLFIELEEEGSDVPEVSRVRFKMGMNMSELANQAFNEDRIDEAKEDALIAMKYFRESMQQLKGANLTPSVSASTGILQAIDRARIYIERLEKITEKFSETGYRTSVINERIDLAKTILNNASNLVNEGRIEQSVKNLGEAKRVIAGLVGDLNRILRAETNKKIKNFSDQSISRLNELEMKADEILIPDEAAHIKTSIDRAKHLINQARIYMNQEKYQLAITELEKMIVEAENGDNELVKKLPVAENRLRASLSKINGRINEFQRILISVENRTDTMLVQEKLVNAKNLVRKVSDEFNSGDLRYASRTLDELAGKIIDIDDEIHEIQKNLR